jgi:ABC-2 type transport system ATP-binding protein
LLASEARRETGWLPQAFGFPPQMTVAEFLRYAAWLKGLAKSETAGHVDIALALADLESVRSQRLGQLSGGTLRRAGLAASLVHQPGLLILDEPTAGLDPVQRADFHIRLRTLATTRTVVLATHLLEDVHELADDIFVLDEGRVIWHGTAAELADVGGPGQQGTAGLRAGIMRLIGHTL